MNNLTKNHFTKRNILNGIFALLILLFLLISSCSTTRKCDGRKGIKTPMGLM